MLADDWKDKFVAMLVETGNVSAAARVAGVSRGYAYEVKKVDLEFSERWNDAIEEGVDLLAQKARERALDQSDVLTMFLLKAHRPEKYRENVKLEHDGTVNINVNYADYDHDYLTAAPPGPATDPE